MILSTTINIPRFLGSQFSTYGLDVLTMVTGTPEDNMNPMNVVFPKVKILEGHSILKMKIKKAKAQIE